VYGFVLNEANLPFETSEDVENLADELLTSMSAETYPHLTELIVQLAPGYSYGDEFEFGLVLILDALETRLAT
jgi:hypothetical protein